MFEHLVAIVGAGQIGRLHAENIASGVERLRVVAVADPARSASERLANHFGWDSHDDWRELLERSEVEALLLCSPPRFHAEQIIAAANAGKHVFCEKPITVDLAAADEALEATEAAGIVLQIGYNRRFDRNFAALREAIAEGRVGAPLIIRITARDPEPPPRAYLEQTPGLLMETTTHDLDLVRFVSGAEIAEVSTRAGALASEDSRELGLVDTAVTTVVLDTGALGAIDNCWVSSYGYDQRLEVHGSEGMVQARNEVRDTTVVADATGFHEPVLPHFFLDRYAPAYVRELEAFADALEGAASPVTGHDGRAALAASLAAVRSAAEGRAVSLDAIG